MERQNILYLVHRVPYPPDKGDRIRAFHILQYLQQHANVDLACLADEEVSNDTIDVLRRHCRRVAIGRLGLLRWGKALGSLLRGRTITEGAFSSSAFRRQIRDWARTTRYQAVLASSSSMIPYLRLKELEGLPAVVDLVDVDSQKWLDYAQKRRWPKSWLLTVEAHRLRRVEKQLPTWARSVLLATEAEANIYREFACHGDIRSVTNGVDLEYFRPSLGCSSNGEQCLFVGALDYYPNIDAACWFCENVWSSIRAVKTTAEFLMVGRNPPQKVCKLASAAGVKVIGSVPDVRPYLHDAAVVVVPLRIARGIQNKVLEALAMGKAVVASPEAIEGLKVQPGVHLLCASTPSEWTNSITALLHDSKRRGELGAAGRHYVEENHSWNACLQSLPSILGLCATDGECALPSPARHRHLDLRRSYSTQS